MKMCPKFRCLFFLLWTFDVNSQLLNYPGLNSGCTSCPVSAQSNGNYYVNNPWYPQSGQVIYQYPQTGQYYQQYLPYAYLNNQPQSSGSHQLLLQTQITPGSNLPVSGVPAKQTNGDSKIKFENVKTEVIDIDPQSFRYLYSRYYLPNAVTVPKSRKVSISKDSPYVVKVESHQYNSTSVPQVFRKHDVQHKTFTFKKTYVLKPGNKDSVINLNFVNGVPVTTETSNDLQTETTTLPPSTTTTEESVSTTTEEPATTTENDTPVSVNGWFI